MSTGAGTLKTEQRKCQKYGGNNMKLNFSVADTKTQKSRVKPGTYDSVVTYVGFSEEHVTGEVLRVEYELDAKDGTRLHHHEVFYLKNWADRTRDFAKYLNAHGISFYDTDEIIRDLMGLREELVIKKSTAGKGFMTIESRKFLGKAE